MRLCGQVIDRLLPGESKVYENDLDALVDGSVPTVCTVQCIIDPVVVVRYVRVRSGGFSSKDFFLKIFFKIFKDFYVNLPLSSSFVCLFVFVFFENCKQPTNKLNLEH